MFSNYRQYWDLTKPKVVALIVFTALVGMVLAIPGVPSWEQVRAGLLGFLGIWLAIQTLSDWASSGSAVRSSRPARSLFVSAARTSTPE